MSGPSLQHRHVFGLKSTVKDNIHYVEESVLLYPAGQNIVIYNTKTRTQSFIIPHTGSNDAPDVMHEITAIAVSPNMWYVAVAEKGEDRACIRVYDIRTKGFLVTLRQPATFASTSGSTNQSHEYVNLCFSADSKSLLSQGNGPDHVLVNWLWDKPKPLQITKVEASSVTQCSFCPTDPTHVCVSGKGYLQYFRVDGGQAYLSTITTSLLDRPPDNYTCHAWLSNKRMVVGTDKGELLLFDNALFRSVIKSSPGKGRAITAIKPFSLGFVVGLADGTVQVFEGDKLAFYNMTRSYDLPDTNSAITSIAISPSDDHMAITTSDQQAYEMHMFATDTLRPEDMKFTPLVCGFHSGTISGVDVCIRKPLVVTCGVDKTVRIWNYVNNTVELCKSFREQPYGISFHPSGLHVLIGFQDKLRLCNVLMDDIRCYKEFPIKQCREVQFSHGGQEFAAVNGGLIQIYNFYTCEQTAIFRGHTGKVRSLYWSMSDTSIVSAGEDGAVYEHKIAVTSRAQEYVQKGVKFTSALCTDDNKIYAVSDDNNLKEINGQTVVKAMVFPIQLTQLMVSHSPPRMLFAGTSTGIIRAFKFPLTGGFKDYQAHSGLVTGVRVSQDDAFLFSVSEDGCLTVFSIKEEDGRVSKRDRPDAVTFSEEVLVTKTDLQEKHAIMNDLKAKVDELTANNEYQLRLHDMNYQEKLKAVSEKFNLQIEHDKTRIQHLKDDTQDAEMEYDEKTKGLQAQHADRLHKEDLEHQKTIMREVDAYQELTAVMAKEATQHEGMTRDSHIAHQQAMANLRDTYEIELHKEKLDCQAMQDGKDVINREFVETKRQLEEDTDKEIEQLKAKYDFKLHQERDATLRLKGENGIMRKKFSALQKDIEDQKENIKTMGEKEEELSHHIEELETHIESHKEEILERDRTIGNKEKQIFDLKNDNQELEKYKFVLDYQIKELKRQIEPRENEIADMKERVMKMDGQLESIHRENGLLQDEVGELESKLQKKQQAIRRWRQKYRLALSDLDSLINDFEEIVQHIQDPPRLKAGFKALYTDHVNVQIQAGAVDHAVSKEYKRQRQYLERSVGVLKSKLSRDTKARRNDNMRVMQENVALIKEINDLRGEIKLIRQVQKAKEMNKTQPVGHYGRSSKSKDDENFDEAEVQKLIELQRNQIATLRLEVEQAQARMLYANPI